MNEDMRNNKTPNFHIGGSFKTHSMSAVWVYIVKRIWVLCKPTGSINETSLNGLKNHLQPTSPLSLSTKGKCECIYRGLFIFSWS